MSPATADVAILGGGLAGLTLAIQLKQQDSGIDVVVLERRRHPVREAAHKVGESTVEIGAHYFADVLGFKDHLETRQIRKYGFRFFFSEGRRDIDHCTEVGVSQLLPTPSWQLDRGRFENFLGEQARNLGVRFLDDCSVRKIHLCEDGDPHRVTYRHASAERQLSTRWLVDASGRAGLLKRKLGLAQENAHIANAVWWRVDGHVDPNQWSHDPQWRSRCTPPDRWRSTNHMCGPGYWFWLIPLASDAHSLGIVCDATMHPLETMNTFEKAMAWLHAHQPQVAASLRRPEHRLQDFLFFRDFSYGCKHVFSGNRWAITGEAGLFLDPFYSPGSDFIAISNTYICDLIRKDRAGEHYAAHADVYQQLYFSFYENTLSLYQNQYPLFGDPQVMPLKVIWDYTYYWSLLAPLFFNGYLTNTAVLGKLRKQFERGNALNLAMQALLRQWGALNKGFESAEAGRVRPMLDQYAIDWFRELNRSLNDPLDEEAFVQRIQQHLQRMEWLAKDLSQHARTAHSRIECGELDALLSGVETKSTLPAHWYADAA